MTTGELYLSLGITIGGLLAAMFALSGELDWLVAELRRRSRRKGRRGFVR